MTLLQTRELAKHFGGVFATNNVNLDVVEGETHALIGPNGAGKTTLLAQLAGALRSDSGQVTLAGEDVTRLTQHQRVARGLVRSHQITSIFRSMSVRDNVAYAVLARSGSSLGFWRALRGEAQVYQAAQRILEELDLQQRADTIAADLPHGQQRQLELAIAFATRPKLLLLDEPMAGLGPDESARMLQLLLRLKSKLTLVLVEHDMDAVFQLADRVSVLVSGQIIATGSPAQVRANAQVRASYLGEEAA